MGFIRKVTGADAAKANADRQVKEIERAAADQTRQLMEQTRMAAEMQSIAEQRLTAQSVLEKTSGALDTGTADMALSTQAADTEASKRRAAFRFNQDSGLSL